MNSPTKNVYYSVTKFSEKEFQVVFRAILYDNQLSWGSKCLGLALLDLPADGTFKPAAMARKLRTDATCISRWLADLKRQGFNFYLKKREPGGGSTQTGSVWPPRILNILLQTSWRCVRLKLENRERALSSLTGTGAFFCPLDLLFFFLYSDYVPVKNQPIFSRTQAHLLSNSALEEAYRLAVARPWCSPLMRD